MASFSESYLRFIRLFTNAFWAVWMLITSLTTIGFAWTYINHGFEKPDLLNALTSLGFMAFGFLIYGFQTLILNGVNLVFRKRPAVTSEEIEAGRVMLYGKRKPKD